MLPPATDTFMRSPVRAHTIYPIAPAPSVEERTANMPPPSIEGLLPALARAKEMDLWWDAHHNDLLAIYPERFVAVKDGEVIASNEDVAMLFYSLRDLGLSASRDVSVKFLSSRKGNWLL